MLLKPEVLVLDIQRMSTEDGPGLRTTLFLKGCNLQCRWCHNPDSISVVPAIQWSVVRCIGCNSCRSVCPAGALQHRDDGIFIDSTVCEACSKCVDECPSGALTLRGKVYEADQLLDELLKDKAYFGGDGGITLSGGEPLLQGEAAIWLLRELKKKGINTALDTAGLVPVNILLEAIKYTDLVLFDLKIIESAEHKKFTGSGNAKILANLIETANFCRNESRNLWIRTPIIPGATDNENNIKGIALFIRDNLEDAVERWELCAFNNLCEHKYEMLDRKWAYSGIPIMLRTKLDQLVNAAGKILGGSKTEVLWTGRVAQDHMVESGDHQ